MNSFAPSPVCRPAARAALGLVLACLVVAGCDALVPGDTDEGPTVVVESYQTAGEPLAPVRLSRTVELDSTYAFGQAAVRGADVRVQLLGEDGSVASEVRYGPDPDSVGFYRPRPELQGSTPPTVRPLRTYRLVADIPDGPTVRSTTTVPDTFSIVRANTDSSVYRTGPQIELTLTRSATPNLDQSYYVFTTRALDPTEENLTPLVREFVDDSDDLSLQDLEQTSSPIINEEGYEVNADGTLTIGLPWIAVAFYGPNEARANVLDRNLYDFVRSQSVQEGGGGGLSPGAIPNIIEHVDGGTGIFGSRASVTKRIHVARP